VKYDYAAHSASNALSLSKGFRSDIRRVVDILLADLGLADRLGQCSCFPIGPPQMPPMPDLHPPIACPDPSLGVFWVYILQSADGAYYVGQTCNLPERLRKHRLGLGSKHTSDHAVPLLVYAEAHRTLTDAVQRERYSSVGHARKKKRLSVAISIACGNSASPATEKSMMRRTFLQTGSR
jgi:putative endonuclease